MKIMCLWLSYKKKIWEKLFFCILNKKTIWNFFYFFASLKSLKKEVGSEVGSGFRSSSQRYGSVDPDPHQKVTDPQHW
jgi:hypothetical protein